MIVLSCGAGRLADLLRGQAPTPTGLDATARVAVVPFKPQGPRPNTDAHAERS